MHICVAGMAVLKTSRRIYARPLFPIDNLLLQGLEDEEVLPRSGTFHLSQKSLFARQIGQQLWEHYLVLAGGTRRDETDNTNLQQQSRY